MRNDRKFFGAIGAFFLTALVLLTAFAAGEMYPFGWGTVSWCDMNQQLIPLFCDFKDILEGEKSLFLNLANGGGMNFYGVFFFFLSSPFTFLVALVEKANIPFFMNVLVILKLCLSAFTSGFVLQRLSKNTHWGVASALGSAYSLCGYAMLFYQNIMWLDMMYIFPLVVLGVYRLIEDSKPLMLTVTLTLSVIFNFYISFMVFLFVIFFFGAFAIIYRNADRKIYVNLGVAGFLSLLCSAFVWVPCLLQYFSSARGNSFLDELKTASFYAPYETTLTVLLCSGVIFAALLMLLTKLRTLSKETKFLLLVFSICALPLIIEPVNLMWHTGSYMSFPARYGFIPVFLGLLLVIREFPRPETEKKRGFFIPLTLLIALISLFALAFTLENTETLSAYVNSLWGNKASLQGEIFLCFIFAVCFILILVFHKKGRIKKQLVPLLLCLTVFAESLCSTQIFMLSAKNSISLYKHQSIVALENKTEIDGFYRVNSTHKLTDANMTGAAGFNSLAHYTSLNDQTYMETAKQMGYSGYWMETGNWCGSILSDSLLSVGYTIHEANGEFILKENPYYMGLGIKAKGKIPQKLSSFDRLMSLGNAFSQMSGKENPVVKYEHSSLEECTVYSDEDGYSINNIAEVGTIKYHVKLSQAQTLYFDCYGGFSNRLNEPINKSFAISVNGKTIAESYPTQSLNGLLNLGRYENTVVDITIKVYNTVDCISYGVFGIKENIIKDFTDATDTLNLKADGGTVKGNAKSGNYFISLPYKEDYKITLDGEKLSYSKALGGFISLDVPHSGKLKITFTPKGFYFGIALSVFGLILIVCIQNRKFLYNEKFVNIIYGIFIGGSLAAFLWVYIIPIIVNLSDLKI